MNSEALEEYWNVPERDRRRSVGRRGSDFAICSQHKNTCGEITELKKTTLPRWVFLWVGGPTILLILSFTGWTAIKGINTAEHLVKVEAVQAAKMEAVSANIAELMKHFNLVPVEPKVR